jgi:hypothetical protein
MSVEDTDIRLRRYFDNEIDRIMSRFQKIGETFINEARLTKTYRDQTGNLRSSIGYAIGMDGQATGGNIAPIVKKGQEGHSNADMYGTQLIQSEGGGGSNLTLVGFAGMEYAVDVEARKKDVITEATKRAMRRINAIKGK